MIDVLRQALGDAWRMIVPPPGAGTEALAPLVLSLTFVSGMLDAFALVVIGGVFVGNMTGNVVFIGLGVVGTEGFTLGRAVTALAAFVVGSFLGGRIDDRLGHHRGRLAAATIVLEAACVGVAIAAILVWGAASTPAAFAAASLLALAMGMQTALAHRLAVSNLMTTVLTGTITAVFADTRRQGETRAKFVRGLVAVVALAAGAAFGAKLIEVDPVADLVAAAVILVGLGVAAVLRFHDRPQLGG